MQVLIMTETTCVSFHMYSVLLQSLFVSECVVLTSTWIHGNRDSFRHPSFGNKYPGSTEWQGAGLPLKTEPNIV